MSSDKVYRRWEDGFIVRRMRQDEGQQLTKWFSAMTTIAADLDVVLDIRGDDDADDGLYVGELNRQMIAALTKIPNADDVRHIGMVYVEEPYRKLGYARRMIDLGRELRGHNWNGIYSLYALAHLEQMYQKFGFNTVFQCTHYSGTVSTTFDCGRLGTHVKQISEGDFARVMSYDDKCFIRAGSSWRRDLMSRWIMIPGGRAVMALSQQGDVVGYGCRRPAVDETGNHLIGPLYADSYDSARDLVTSLTSDIVGQTIWLTVPETHEEAVRLVHELKLKGRLHLLGMFRNGDQKPLNHAVYAITSETVCGF